MKNSKHVICITGKSGSGKSTLSPLLAKSLNATYISIDEIGHKIYENYNLQQNMVKTFGCDIIENGVINTKKLGKIVFSNFSKMQKLNELTWPYMEQIIDDNIKNSKSDFVVLDWAILPAIKYFNHFSYNVLVVGDEKKRQTLILNRDNISLEYLLKREKNGINYDGYKFNYIVNNKYENNLLEVSNVLTKLVKKFFME